MNLREANRINKLSGWLSIHEGLFLHAVANEVIAKKGAIVEIGSFQGKSTIYLAKTGQRVTAIDPHMGELDSGTKVSSTYNAFVKNISDFHVKNNICLMRKTSLDAAKNWNKDIKLLFIDGLHDKKNALLDYKKWSPFLIQGGVIAMHDSFCGWEGAQSVALKHIVCNDEYFEVGVVGSIIYGIKGSSNIFTRINRVRIRILIKIAYFIQKQKYISERISFFLIHRIIKLLLLNKYTLGMLSI